MSMSARVQNEDSTRELLGNPEFISSLIFKLGFFTASFIKNFREMRGLNDDHIILAFQKTLLMPSRPL